VKLVVVGLGHIGGSLALSLARAGAAAADEILGCDEDPAAAERARSLGICHRVVTLEQAAAAGADVVAVAVPVRSIGPVVRRLAELDVRGVVTDVGSTKAGVVRAGEAALGGRFVGGHPLAGTERAGPDAADASLFAGRRVILTPTPRTEPAARERVTAMWQAVGATVIEMDAERHDQVMAAVSHLPHVVAYSLAGAIGALGGAELKGLTGGGFLDTTRIASTPPRMWIDVFQDNRDALLACVDEFQEWVASLRWAILRGDAREIERILVDARTARERILG
jgi:prephenate dehydrogenase